MNAYKESEKEYYKIKVNKKGSNNKLSNSQNCFNKQNIYKNKDSTGYTKPSQKSNNHHPIITPFHNKYNSNVQIIKYKLNSNSEEKNKKGKTKINYLFEQNNNYINADINLKDTFNIKSQKKSILNFENINENLLNFQPNIFNNLSNKKSLNNENIFKNGKFETNKKPNLSIRTNNNEEIDNKNYRTIEHNNVNNFINEFQLINNYYDYEKEEQKKLNNLNFQTYYKNIIYSSERKKYNNSYNDSNPLLNYSSDKIPNNIHINYKYNDYDNNKINTKFNNSTFNFKSKIFSKKNNKGNKDNPTNTINKKINKKEININDKKNSIRFKLINNNIDKKTKNKNIYVKSKSQYGNTGYIKKDNYNTFKYNKYDYNKKLFDIYRGKLIQEFIRHLKIIINNHLLEYFKLLIYYIKYLNIFNPNKDLNSPKIYLNKTHNENKNINLVGSKNRKSILKNTNNKNKNQNCIKIYYSDKKFPHEKELDKILTTKKKTNLFSYSTINSNNEINKLKFNNNTNFKKYNQTKNKLQNSNNRLIKHFDKIKNPNQNKNDYNMRNSLNLNNNKMNFENISQSNNIKIIDINNSLNNYIYKKKVKANKNNTYINKSNKSDNIINISMNKKIELNNVLNNLKGKIIDIDINLGKPVKDINDKSSFNGFFINDYNNKNYNYKSSLSSNLNEKQRRKHKNKKKMLSLPKKKYLEEGYDIIPSINNEEEDKYSFRTNSWGNKNDNSKKLKNLNNSMNINIEKKINSEKKIYKNILVKNIVTSDKRLFIHINYISLYNKNKNIISNKKMLYINLHIEIVNYFSIYSTFISKPLIKHKNKTTSNNSFFEMYSRNNINFEKEFEKLNRTNYRKNKYLLSCVKFIIKTINKIFLYKAFSHYKKCLENKRNTNKKGNIYKCEIQTYKKKISKGKILKDIS